MLCCDRIDVSEGTDINKRSPPREWYLSRRYWNFLGKEFKFVSHVCNECYVLMKSINLSNIYMLKVNGAHYHFIINGISKSDAVNLLESAGLIEESGVLKNKKNIKNLLPYIKWVKKL